MACLCVCVCVPSHLLHSENQNTCSTSKVGTGLCNINMSVCVHVCVRVEREVMRFFIFRANKDAECRVGISGFYPTSAGPAGPASTSIEFGPKFKTCLFHRIKGQ